MKVKELVQKYNLDETEFDRFLLIKDIPVKRTFSGDVIADENVEKYVAQFHESQNSMKQKAANAASARKETLDQFHKRLGILFTLSGARGRTLIVCQNKCIIRTSVTVGSVITGNATDGEKMIFYRDCSGLQFKESGLTLGYLQLETPSMQMNNMASNFFSENTYTFDNPGDNLMMREVYYFIMEMMERHKYQANPEPITELPPSLAQYVEMVK